MEIRKINFKWNENMSVFCSENYLSSLISDEYGWIGGFEKEELIYVLAYIRKKKFIFNYVQFHTSVLKINEGITEEEDFLKKVIKFLKKDKIDFIICPSTNSLFSKIPTLKNIKKCDFGSYTLDLKKSEEELWEGMNGKHRNVVRKAIKNGLTVKLNEKNLKKAYDLLEETLNRSKMSMGTFENFKKVIGNLGENKIKVTSVYAGEKLQGVAVFLYSNFRVYYWYGGSISNISTGAMNLLHWEAIKYFKNIGVQTYDFLGARVNPIKGSKLEGIQRFKERFGCKMERGFLWKISINEKKYRMYEWLLKVKSFLKNKPYAGDIIDQELFNGVIKEKNGE